MIDKGLGFYKQSLKNPAKIGEKFADIYQQWAWNAGRNEFPTTMFGENTEAHAYIKYKIAEYLKRLIPGSISELGGDNYKEEIKALGNIKPHTIITTNYDSMLEMIFPLYTPVVGQQIIRGQQFCVGEIYKIHGSVDNSSEIVFTQSDYDVFIKKKKFLNARLLTFFSEHPIIFVGYSASDPNIQSILSDLDEAMPVQGGIIPNVYIVEWKNNLNEDSNPPRDKVIPTEDGRSVRVKLIEAEDFRWIFDAFAANPVLNNVSPRVLRSLIARSYNLVRRDIPAMTVEANFEMLDQAVADSESFAKLFGIANVDDYSALSARYFLTASEMTKRLGGKGSHLVVKLLQKIKQDKGIDIRDSDNMYHLHLKINKTKFHKYSMKALELLRKVRDGSDYDLEMHSK